MGSDWAVRCIDYESLRILLCISKCLERLQAASEIKLITICKCYSCFSNRLGLTLEARVYIHTHEPKARLNADTTQRTLKAHCTKEIRSNSAQPAWIWERTYAFPRPRDSALSHRCNELVSLWGARTRHRPRPYIHSSLSSKRCNVC